MSIKNNKKETKDVIIHKVNSCKETKSSAVNGAEENIEVLMFLDVDSISGMTQINFLTLRSILILVLIFR